MVSLALLMATGVAAALLGVRGAAGGAVVVVEVPRADPRKLVIDTDAGADDAVAILELLLAENMQLPNGPLGPPRVLAVTCVHGNTGVRNVTRNVFVVLRAAGRQDVPVYSGAEVSLLPPRPAWSDYFGEDGFGDFLPPGQPAGQPQPEHAAVALVRLARENAGELTLVCIGPLTNVALAIRLDPGFLDNLQDLYILGGVAHGNGNAGPGSEFNFLTDPDSALVVFDAVKKPLYLMPWETSLEAEVPMAWRREVLGAVRSEAVALLNLAERVVLARQSGVWQASDGLLAAHLLDTRVVDRQCLVRVSVLGGSGPGRGVTLVDYSNTSALPANSVLLEKADATAFQRLLLHLFS